MQLLVGAYLCTFIPTISRRNNLCFSIIFSPVASFSHVLSSLYHTVVVPAWTFGRATSVHRASKLRIIRAMFLSALLNTYPLYHG